MLKNLRFLSLWQRRLVFFFFFGGILMIIAAVFWLLARQALTGGDRVQAAGLLPGVTVTPFAALPDGDAYPAALVYSANSGGTVYTGSYVTGAIWAIGADGTVTEIPGTRDGIGSVSAIAVLPGAGGLLVVDQEDADPRTAGGQILRVNGRVDDIAVFATIPDETGFIAPNDIEIDARGVVYVSDPGRNEVWRFDADGANGAVWWVAPAPEPIPGQDTTPRRGLTGLAYDAAGDAMLISDPENNEIFRVRISDGETERVYRHGRRDRPPGFDGLTVTADGAIYVAALGTNGVARVYPAGSERGGVDGELEYIAGVFRGASDVAFAAPNLLYVSNFDQASLAPLPVPLFAPQLPFALDVIALPAEEG